MKQGIDIRSCVICLLLLSGCANILLAGASGGVAYTITNIAYKTLIYPIDRVEFATHLALIKMGIKYVESEETEDGVKILAETYELTIHILLEKITSRTTKISVDAAKSIIAKDKATATAIIEETEAMLEMD